MADSAFQNERYSADNFDKPMLMSIYQAYKTQAETARLSRIQQNKVNFDAYHMRQDFSYKQKGQSQEFLPKLSLAVETAANYMQQGLIDMGEWFRVYPAMGLNEDMMKIKPHEIQKILLYQLEKTSFMAKMNDSIKLGFLGSLMVAKVHGKYVNKPSYHVSTKLEKGAYKRRLIKRDDKKWQLDISLVRQQDWKPDPVKEHGLYKMQDMYLDWHELEAMGKRENSGIDMDVVMEMKSQPALMSALQEYEKSRETAQNVNNVNFRHQIKLTEIWGNFVAPDGTLVWENCQAIIANDLHVVMKPRPIKFWHAEDPYISCPILRVPHSVWGKTPMDAAALLNIAANEMFNLILDGGLAAVHGIKQVREHWLEDPSQLEDGLAPGTTLRVNTSCPPGATAFERVDTTTIPPEVLPVYNTLVQEFVTAAMTSDLRMGVTPFHQVKATEIVESSQANSTMFAAIAKHIEADFVKPLLHKCWLTIAQHFGEMDPRELGTVLGDKRAEEILMMGPEGIFAETAGQVKFEVFGISETLNKQKEFTKLQAMLQTISSSPVIMEEFTKKYDFGKLLTEIMRSIDVPMYKIMNDDILNNNPMGQQQASPGPGGPPQPGQPPGPAGQPNAVPNMQSQIPQAGAAVNQGGQSPFPQPNFPASRALAAEGR
jgi:hypothetical protein